MLQEEVWVKNYFSGTSRHEPEQRVKKGLCQLMSQKISNLSTKQVQILES